METHFLWGAARVAECLLWGLVVSKRFGSRRIAAFHAPKPFAIIGERERVDDRRYEASIASDAKIRHVTGVMTRAEPRLYALRAAISGWMPRVFSTRVRLSASTCSAISPLTLGSRFSCESASNDDPQADYH
jgi:hypothetical protein